MRDVASSRATLRHVIPRRGTRVTGTTTMALRKSELHSGPPFCLVSPAFFYLPVGAREKGQTLKKRDSNVAIPRSRAAMITNRDVRANCGIGADQCHDVPFASCEKKSSHVTVPKFRRFEERERDDKRDWQKNRRDHIFRRGNEWGLIFFWGWGIVQSTSISWFRGFFIRVIDSLVYGVSSN